MARALVFTVIFSELFENGPISEASIGNVARQHDRTGWVDHVWTPVGGVLWAMAEDAIDKYVLTEVDRRVPFVVARIAARMILNPGRMLANVSQNRAPWFRSNRPVSFTQVGTEPVWFARRIDKQRLLSIVIQGDVMRMSERGVCSSAES
jgi:hypothetical protein